MSKTETIAKEAERLATAWKYEGEDREFFIGDVETVCEVAYDAGYRDATSPTFEVGGQTLTAKSAVELLWRYKRALEGFTPGGSEFVNDPERCAEHAKKMRGMERKMGYRDAIRDAANAICDQCRAGDKAVRYANKDLGITGWMHSDEMDCGAAEIRKLGQ